MFIQSIQSLAEDEYVLADNSMTEEEMRMKEMPRNRALKKKTRRGKKKRHFYRNLKDDISDEQIESDSCGKCNIIKSYWKGTNDSGRKCRKNRGQRKSRPTLRPRHSPKAPHNSNQFLMDDHFKYSLEYLKFDSPDPFGERISYDNDNDFENSPETMFNVGPDSDVTFYQDVETKEFMEKEFEDHYNQIRVNDLREMSKSELVDKLLSMEKLAQDLENQLDSSPDRPGRLNVQHQGNGMIQSLQKEIEGLKEENSRLKVLLHS